MIEDNEIEAKESPFAVKDGEIKVFDGKDGYVSMNQIVSRIDRGHINELHFSILEIVNEFEFVTSRQLCQLLSFKNIDYKSQDKLNNKLEQMVKNKILTRYYFTSGEGKGIYKIYCLEKMGKYLLDSRSIDSNWQQSDNTKPVTMIKKRLAGNQILIAYKRKVKTFDSYVVKPVLQAKISRKVFKVTGGGVKLSKNKKTIDFLFEIIRREDEWEKKIIERFKFYQEFYNNFQVMDCGFEAIPQLIFVCEDEKHMAETFKVIISNKIEIEHIKMLFTTDLRQNNESLVDTLVEFQLDEETNKYKKVDIELKLLA